MRMKRGGCSREVPAARVFTRRLPTRPTVQPWPYAAGPDVSYLLVIANSGGGQQREQHVMCEAAHFMTVIPRDLEMVSDDGFLPVLHQASTAGFI